MLKRKILAIDDERDFLHMLKLNLEETGKFEVLALNSAKDIISRINSFRPDIILIDMIMPEVGGMEACGMLNDDPLGQKTPIIVISALEKDKDKLKAYKLGVVDYLVKPIEIKDVIAKIEKALEFK